jgi:Flp pilus assembly protein TadG
MDTTMVRDRRHGSLTRRTPAQALVEAAVVFPLVVLLLVLVQGALYVHARHVVLGAAREGAHVAASEHATIDEALADGRARAESVLVAGLGGYAANMQVLDPTDDRGSVVVQIQGSMPLLLAGPGGGSLLQIPLEATARASREFFRPQGGGGY